MDLVPLRVRIGLKEVRDEKTGLSRKAAAYPFSNEDQLDFQDKVCNGMDWCNYIDLFGSGQLYDKEAGHQEHDPANGSPAGKQWTMLLVPLAFAEEAVSRYGDDCMIITEASARSFYNNRHAHSQPEVKEDREALENLKLRIELGELSKDDQEYKDAVNPDKAVPGRRRNKRKRWEGLKQEFDYNVIQPTRPLAVELDTEDPNNPDFRFKPRE